MGVKIDGNKIELKKIYHYFLIVKIGRIRSAAYSPKFKRIVGIAMIKTEYSKIKQKFQLNLDDNKLNGKSSFQ